MVASPDGHSLLDEAKAAPVAEEIVGRRVVGHEQVGLAVVVEVGRDDSQAASVAVDDARLGGHVDEPAAVVAEDMVRQRGEKARVAVGILRAVPAIAGGRGCRVPLQVVADVEIEVAVVVQVGPGRRGRPVAVAAEPRTRRDVLEPAVAEVVVEGVGPPSGDEQVGPAVVVVVAHGDPVPVAAGQRGQAGRGGGVLEPAVAAVAEEAVTEGERGAVRRGERSPLNGVNVEPTIAVEVEERHAAAHGLGELAEVAAPVVEGEGEAPSLGVVGEGGDAHGAGDRGLCSPLAAKRPEEVGERPAVGRGRRLGLCQASQRGRGLGPGGLIPAGRQLPPGLGVERSAERLGGAGELGRVRRRVDLVHQRRVAIARRVSRRLAASAARRVARSRRPARPGQPAARGRRPRPAPGRRAFRGPRARPGDRRSARPTRRRAPAPAPGASPKRAGVWPRARARQAGRRPGPIRAGRARPRSRRAAPARTASSQSPASSKRPERVARSAWASQTRSSSGAILPAFSSVLAHPFDRIRLVVEAPEQAQGLGGIARVVELAAQEASVFVVPAGDPVKVSEEPSRLVGEVAPRADGAVEARLGEPVAAGARWRAGRVTAPRGGPRGPGPGHGPKPPGRLPHGPGHLAGAKRILDFALAGPALRQPGQTHPGRTEPPRAQITLRLAQLGVELPGLHRPDGEPARQGRREPNCQDPPRDVASSAWSSTPGVCAQRGRGTRRNARGPREDKRHAID